MQTPDTIEIRRLRVSTHIGVPDAERAEPQTLWVTLRLITTPLPWKSKPSPPPNPAT